MAKSYRQLLADADDFELCDDVFTLLLEYHGDNIEPAAVGAEERVVLLVWNASGIIGNGGFRYLFEGNLQGDPDFSRTAEAFQATGCKKAADAVRKTLAMFPDSRPQRNIEERLRHYLSRIKAWPTEMDMKFFAARDDLTGHLAGFIRSHSEAFSHLDSPKATRLPRERPKPNEVPPKQKSRTNRTVAKLPRWARVAFAARCARQVFPLLARHWPNVPSKRSNAVRSAIDLAEQSAAEGRTVEGLEDTVWKAVAVAGAALASRPGFARGRSRPENAYSGTIASFVAKAAEKAAESAKADSEEGLLAAWEAWHFASSAANSAEEASLLDGLDDDFRKIHRAAIRGKWTDRTKIPSEIWVML